MPSTLPRVHPRWPRLRKFREKDLEMRHILKFFSTLLVNLTLIEIPSVNPSESLSRFSLAPRSAVIETQEQAPTTLRWKNPAGEKIEETFLRLSGEGGAIVEAERLKGSLLQQGFSQEHIEAAIVELYLDPTQHITFDEHIAGQIQMGLKELLQRNASKLIGPVREIVVRKGLLGESPSATVQLIGSRLIFTLYATYKAKFAEVELERLLPNVQSEIIQALREKRTLLGFDSEEFESFLKDRYSPLVSRLRNRGDDELLLESEDRELREVLSSLPISQGLFERSLDIFLPKELKVNDVIIFNDEMLNSYIFLPNGYYFRFDTGTLCKISRSKARPYLGEILKTHYFKRIAGGAGSFASRNQAFIDIGNVEGKWAGVRRWDGIGREKKRQALQGYKENILGKVDNHLREFASDILDIMIDRLSPNSYEEEKRRILQENVVEEEAHVEDYIFACLVAGKAVTEYFPASEVSKFSLRLGAVFGLQMFDLRPNNFLSFIPESEREKTWEVFVQNLWKGVAEVRAAFNIFILLPQKERAIVSYFASALESDVLQERPEAVSFFWLVPSFFYWMQAKFPDKMQALEALKEYPDHLLGSICKSLYLYNFYSEEERIKILEAKTSRDRAQVLLDFVQVGARIGRKQIDQFQPQFGMDSEQIIRLIRNRLDFQEEGGFFKKEPFVPSPSIDQAV